MSLTQEKLESLEAYLDGLLDPQSSEVLHREIASNANLRKVMSELAKTRQWVTELPRAAAPGDLIETFQGQLERSALLGDEVAENPEIVLRIRPSTHWMSVAAIMLLAAGVVMIIVKMLPERHSTSVAIDTSPHGRSEPAASGDQKSKSAKVDRRAEDTIALDSTTRSKDSDLAKGTEGAQSRPLATAGTDSAVASTPAGGFQPLDAAAAKKPADAPMPVAAKPDALVGSAPLAAKNGPEVPVPDRLKVVTSDDVREVQRKMAAGEITQGALKVGVPASDSANRDLKGEKNDGLPNWNAAEDPIRLVVKAQDPRQAGQDVVNFFAKNKIVYDTGADAANRAYAMSANGSDAAAGGLAKQDAGRVGGQGFGGGGGASGYSNNTGTPASQAGGGRNDYGNNYNNNAGARNGTQSPAQNSTVNVGPPGGNNGYERSALNNQQQPTAPAPAREPTQATVPNDVNTKNAIPGEPKPGAATATVMPTGSMRFRALLTTRQQSELNDAIAQRGNQWTEQEEKRSVPAPEERMKVAQGDGVGTFAKKEALKPSEQMRQRMDQQNAGNKVGERRDGGAAADEPRIVFIQVLDQSVTLPTSLPTTRPASGPPAAKQ